MFLTTKCGNKCKYCPARPAVRYPYSVAEMADFSSVVENTIECAELGVKVIHYEGGDVTLFERLPEVLELCNDLGMRSSISLSGRDIVSRMGSKLEKVISLPSLLKLSYDGEGCHDSYRGKGNLDFLQHASEVAMRVREPGTTRLVFTFVPGPDGNINSKEADSVLLKAEKSGFEIIMGLLFGTYFIGNKDEVDREWAALTPDQAEVIAWFTRESSVNPGSLKKLQVLFEGGNNVEKPICRAHEAVLTISASNRLVGPCFHNPYANSQIGRGGIIEAASSLEWQDGASISGKHEFCAGCTLWCNLMPSLALDYSGDIQEWTRAISGI